MRGLFSSTARHVLLLLALGMSARADQPVTFDLSDSLELSGRPRPATTLGTTTLVPGNSLRLQELDPGKRQTGLDGLLERVSGGGIKLDALAKQLKAPASPAVEPPRRRPLSTSGSRPGALPADRSLRLTTRLDGMAPRPLGEFKTRDWNALGDVRTLAALGGDLTAPRPLPKLELGALAAEAAPLATPLKPQASRLKPPASSLPPDASDTGPAAMARAQDSLAAVQAAGLKRAKPRTSSEPLFVLPDFGTSSFQVGASFSLSGRPLGRIGFSEKAGPFEAGLGARGRLLEPDGADTLRLNDAEPVESKPRKGDDGRLWTGVVYNF